eukprot:163357_1
MTAIVLLLCLVSICYGAVKPYSVSGFSSGGCFVTQHGVAFSNDVLGVGLIAGAAYDCMADPNCQKNPGHVNINKLKANTQNFSNEGYIDNWQNIAKQKVYLYSGSKDTLVPTTMVQSAQDYYNAFGTTTTFMKTIASEHAMVTNWYGNACSAFKYPWIDNCNFDLAGKILEYIHGSLNPPANQTSLPSKNLFTIDQTKYIPENKNAHSVSLGNDAYIYKSSQCSIAPLTQGCRLHIVYHGCGQYAGYMGNTYPKDTGYNGWAETNKFVVLYPQTTSNTALGNSNGCWDWWGYNGKDYLWKTGVQLATVNNMIQYIFG